LGLRGTTGIRLLQATRSRSCDFIFFPLFLPLHITQQLFTMSEEEDNDFVIESTDAGASATIPMEAGQIKKGG
jgi:hypothetical protein